MKPPPAAPHIKRVRDRTTHRKGQGTRRKPSVDQGALVKPAEAKRSAARDRVHGLIDKATGPHGVMILQALAVIALGDAQSRQQFFGEAFRVQAKDRNFALAQLALRRFGRAPLHVPGINPDDPMSLPVVIQHIYSTDVIDVEASEAM